MEKTIKQCPHCGSSQGIYVYQTYINAPYNMGFDKEEQDNSEMYDHAKQVNCGKIAYCQECRKPICKLSTLENQWEE